MTGAARYAVFAALALHGLLGALFPTISFALPREARVPGGVALISLGAADTQDKPRAWLDEQPVWVARKNQQWWAIVGIGLDALPGRRELRVATQTGERTVRFDVASKRYPEQRITLKDSSRVSLSPENEARALAEIARIQEIKRTWHDGPVVDEQAYRFILPTEGRRASQFGLRRFFNNEPRAPHNGMDLAVPRGTAVKASADGTVLAVDDYFFNGKTVFVDHGNGLITMVCHLDQIDVRADQAITRGDMLGRAGRTGRASGPHVHWSVVLNGVMVDPALFIK